MSFEVALKRLSLRPVSICRKCRRTLVSSAVTRQSATATFAGTYIFLRNSLLENQVDRHAESLTSDRNQSNTNGPARSRMSALSGNQPSMLGRTTSEPDRLVPRTSFDVAEEAITPIAEAQRIKAAEQRAQRIAQPWDRGDLEKQVFRRWKAGDVYAPHDLTGVEQAKWKKLRRKGRARMDVLDQLNINPIQHYKVRSTRAARYLTRSLMLTLCCV